MDEVTTGRPPWPTWGRRSDGLWGCDTCCNGDRCDDPQHVDRRHCPVCKGTGAIPPAPTPPDTAEEP